MSELKTEYRGYEIRYGQNTDAWECYDCGVSEPTLTKAKSKIDSLHLKLRKRSAVTAYELSHTNGQGGKFEVSVKEAQLIDIGKSRRDSRWENGKRVPVVREFIVSMCDRNNSGRKSRRDCETSNLVAITPEAHAAIDEANRLGEIATEAVARFNEAAKAIPRMSLADVPGLVQAAAHTFEEGES